MTFDNFMTLPAAGSLLKIVREAQDELYLPVLLEQLHAERYPAYVSLHRWQDASGRRRTDYRLDHFQQERDNITHRLAVEDRLRAMADFRVACLTGPILFNNLHD
jgi:hypothetical protein